MKKEPEREREGKAGVQKSDAGGGGKGVLRRVNSL
jgi:hypothetical protein